MTRSGFGLGLLGVALLAAAAGCNGGTRTGEAAAGGSDPIVVGEFGSLTGTTATFGQSTHQGIMLAVDEINAAGGVKGRTITVITEDDQSRPEEAATVVAKLINQNRVIALLGEVASSRSLAAAPKAQSAGVPMITPSSTNPKVTQVGDYIFRVCYLDDFQGRSMARFVWAGLGAKRAAVLRDIRNDYSVGLADFFTQEFVRLGGEIVSDQSYSEGDSDFKAQLTAIKPANPDVLFVPGYYTEIGQIAIQARDLGIKAPLAGGDGWESPRLLEIGGKALEGCYYSNHFYAEDPSSTVAGFIERYRAKYGVVPDSLAALAYDATKLLADAMTRAPEISSRAIRDELAKTRGFVGVTGTITIDENRNPIKPIVILKIEGGRMVLHETIEPS